jgi:hypothetical protein
MRADARNRIRIFADVVTVDAWHPGFTPETPIVDLHADIVFRAARLGAETDSPVRFRLAIKRAEVVIVIPPNEEVTVLKASVARDQSVKQGTLRRSADTSQTLHAGLKGQAKMGTSNPKLSVAVHSGANYDSETKSQFLSETEVNLILVTQTKTPEGFYRWELEPASGRALEGRGWDALTQPRLKLKDKRRKKVGIPPTVHIEVRCRAEDLLIENITLKDDGLMKRLKRVTGFDNRRAAAQAYIMRRLSEEQLEFDNMSDPYGVVCLANVIAEAQ